MYHSSTQSLQSDLYPKKATIYRPTDAPPRANLLYFHGGGLLYGDREDLPTSHIEAFTTAGYGIVAFDYPLAPNADIRTIFEDVEQSVSDYLSGAIKEIDASLPFFLWGRSAGAYLCLVSACKLLPENARQRMRGVISYYGYGFLCDRWFDSVNPYYATLPKVSEESVATSSTIYAHAPMQTHYNAYVYARQSGNWRTLFYQGTIESFLSQFSLRDIDHVPTALFCAHSINDTDVPYEEFSAICEKFGAVRYVSTSKDHDFDRTDSPFLRSQLYQATIRFIERRLIED